MADFDYGNARLHAMKAKLLTSRQLEEMAGMESLSSVVSALMKTAYQEAVEYSIARATGFETIFQALRQDMLVTMRKISTIYQQDAGEMVHWVLRGYDIHNLKAVLRGLGKHIAPAEIRASLVPVGELDENMLVELSRAATPRIAVDLLASIDRMFARPLLDLRVERPGADIAILEIALERWYYQEYGRYLETVPQGNQVIHEAYALEADITNLVTTLRFAHAPEERKILQDQFKAISSDKTGNSQSSHELSAFRQLFVGPGRLSFSLLENLALQDDMANAIKLLSRTPYAPSLATGLLAYQRSGRLSDIERQLQRYRLHWMALQISRDPLGIGVFFGYLALKLNEISNLRWIAQGIQAGLRPEAIRSEMEFTG